jgi:hypothetical protein
VIISSVFVDTELEILVNYSDQLSTTESIPVSVIVSPSPTITPPKVLVEDIGNIY